jgi:hypothetical protein
MHDVLGVLLSSKYVSLDLQIPEAFCRAICPRYYQRQSLRFLGIRHVNHAHARKR